MKLRRTTLNEGHATAPLDGTDMHLLSGAENGLTLEQLIDVSPCSSRETTQRIAKLVRAGLLAVTDPEDEEAAGAPLELDELVLPPFQAGQEESLDWDESLPVPAAFDDAPPAPLLFEADPPSTLLSVLRRGPTGVDIQFHMAPPEIPARAAKVSDVFRVVPAEEEQTGHGSDRPSKRK